MIQSKVNLPTSWVSDIIIKTFIQLFCWKQRIDYEELVTNDKLENGTNYLAAYGWIDGNIDQLSAVCNNKN